MLSKAREASAIGAYLKKKEAEAKNCKHEWANIYPPSPFGTNGCTKCGISKRGYEGRGPLKFLNKKEAHPEG
jgi:hypothetical protein